MSDNHTLKSRGGVIAHWMNRLVRRFGFVLLPISEIDRMESDGRENYEAMHNIDGITTTKSYFNGLADYASKKSLQLRERYLPYGRETCRAQDEAWVRRHVKPNDPPNAELTREGSEAQGAERPES